MALRRDQIQALKDSLCLDNVDPATRSALNNLVDNLIPLFESAAIPELEDLGGISSGAGVNPGDEANMQGGTPPLGGGGKAPFDGLGGFEDPPPGEFIDDGGGGGGDPGGGQQQPGSGPQCVDIFIAKADAEIPAANGDMPGEGFITLMSLKSKTPSDEEREDAEFLGVDPPEEITREDFENCRQKCNEEVFGLTLDEIISPDDAEFLGITQDQAAKGLMTDCLKKCNEDVEFQKIDGQEPISAYNISCETIAADSTLVVSYNWCTGDAYVLVEACGCD